MNEEYLQSKNSLIRSAVLTQLTTHECDGQMDRLNCHSAYRPTAFAYMRREAKIDSLPPYMRNIFVSMPRVHIALLQRIAREMFMLWRYILHIVTVVVVGSCCSCDV